MRTTLTLAMTNTAPILVLYLEQLNFSARKIGLFLSLTLLGDVVVSLCVAWTADRLGRRRVLAAGSAAMAGSGVSCRPTSRISPGTPVLIMPRTARLCRFPELRRAPCRCYARSHFSVSRAPSQVKHLAIPDELKRRAVPVTKSDLSMRSRRRCSDNSLQLKTESLLVLFSAA